MRSRRSLIPLACLTVLAVHAPVAAADAARKPIVYVVVIDGLDGDSVESEKAPFSRPGALRRR